MRLFFLFATLLLAVFSQCVGAQQMPTPGSVQQSLPQEDLSRLHPPSSQIVFPAQQAPSPFDQDDERIPVYAFDIQGATAFTQERLKRLLERFVDTELNLYDLNDAADEITHFYHMRGYSLARAYIPAQTVIDGVVRIEVVEGRLGEVSIQGNQRYSTSFLQDRLPFLHSGELATTRRLESDLLQTNELPGVRSRVVLSPGSGFGLTNAEVQVEERLMDGNLNYANAARKESGQHRLQATLNLNAPFGWGDRLSLSGITTEHRLVKYGKAAYSFPLGCSGLRFNLHASKLSYEFSGRLARFGLTGESRSKGVDFIFPLLRTREDRRTLLFGYKHSRNSQKLHETTISETRLKFYTLSFIRSQLHEDASISNLVVRFDSNFKANSKGWEQDKLGGRLDIDFNHIAPAFGVWDFYLRSNLVYSSKTLPDAEKFSLGGPESVRGFRASETRGDTGLLLTLEMRRSWPVAGLMSQIRVGGDLGWAVHKYPGYRDSTERLQSLGAGISFFPARNAVASFDLAFPVKTNRDVPERNKARLWVNVSANF